MTTITPTEEEFDAPDEWQQLADTCLHSLKAHGCSVKLEDTGILEAMPLSEWSIFQEYNRLIPIFTIRFIDYQKAELSICTANVSLPTIKAYTAPNMLFTSEVSDLTELHSDISDARLYCVLAMTNDPGPLYIEPLDLEGSISNLFHRSSLDIEGFGEFTKHYHVDIGQPEIAQEVLTPYFFEVIRDLGPIHIEINNGWLIAGYKTPATAEQATLLGSFVQAVATAKE